MNSSVSTSFTNALSNLPTLTTHLIQTNLTNLITQATLIHNETKASIPDAIPDKKGSAEEEHSFSMTIFFVLSVIGNYLV